MLHGNRGFPNVLVQHLLQVDVVVLVLTERVPDYVSHLEPGVHENYLDYLEEWECPEDGQSVHHLCLVTLTDVLGAEHSEYNPGVYGHHDCLAVNKRKRVVLVLGDMVQLVHKSVQLSDEVLLILYFTPLTVRVVCVDQGCSPVEGDPPLLLPGTWLSTLKFTKLVQLAAALKLT